MLIPKTCVQVGVVVADLERTMRALAEVFSLAPREVFIQPPPDRPDMRMQYRGAATDSRIQVAMYALGPIDLEIIQPLEGPSIWQDFLDAHGEGIQHLRFNTPDLAAITSYLEAHGIALIEDGGGFNRQVHWGYFDTDDLLGFTLEYVQVPEE